MRMSSVSGPGRKLRRYSLMERRSFPWVYAFLFPTLLLFAVFYVEPILQTFLTSFAKFNGYTSPEWSFDVSNLGGTIFRNYSKLFSMSSFSPALRNLFWWSLIAMTLHVGVGTAVGFLLYQKLKGWKFVRIIFMVPNVISGAAWAMIYRFMFNDDIGVINNMLRSLNPDLHIQWFYSSPAAFWAITFTWVFYAVIVALVVLGDLMAVPASLHEACEIDGANGFQKLIHIDLPLCRNAIGTSILLSVTSRIAMYENIALTSRGGPGNDTYGLALILTKSITDFNYGLANATAMLMFVFGIVTMQIINKVFRMNDSVY